VDIAHILQLIALYAIPGIFAITLHEAAHGYAARHFGDPTAYQAGRISLNPVRHIDPIGTLLIPAVVLFASSGNFAFGWAKPVPVNFARLRNPKRDMFWVAAAGPIANVFMAVLWTLLLKFVAPMCSWPCFGPCFSNSSRPYLQTILPNRLCAWRRAESSSILCSWP